MADILQSGAVWLAGQLQSHAGQTVTYRRGAESVEITATVGQSEYMADDVAGFHGSFVSQDWIIPHSVLVLSEEQITPRRGDTVERTVNGEVETYEVLPPSADSDVYRDMGGQGALWRIHSKRITVEASE